MESFLKKSDKIGKYVFEQYANKFYGQGNFYKLDKIYEIIDNSSFKKKSKKVMKEVVRLSATHSSLKTAFEESEMTGKDIKNVMKRFDKINVSPVVIPRRCGFDKFDNPLNLVLRKYR